MKKESINKFVIDNIIFITKEQYNKYVNSKKIGRINISVELLYDLLDNDYFYKYINNLFNEIIDSIIIVYINEQGVNEIKKYSKMDILSTISSLVSSDEFKFNEKIKNRFDLLISSVNYEKFKEKYSNSKYTCLIDGNNIEIEVNSIFNFLELPTLEYERFFNLDNEDTIDGIKKEYFIYALIKFFRRNEAFDKYYIPKNISDRYRELLLSKKIDLQAINKINETHNLHSEYIKINENLRKEISDSIPKEYNKLEIAIYIYIKLCDILTYDIEYYASSNVESINKKHEDIKQLINISQENNNVLCYEFNAIYSKFLDETLIKYETNASFSDIFGGGHEFLTFKCGKFLVKADSTINSIIYSDIVNVKLNKKLSGLICQNINENTQKEFKKTLDRVYKNYFKEKKSKQQNIIDFNQIILKYKKLRENDNYNLFDKYKKLLYELKESNLKGLDALSYASQLIKVIFNNNESRKNIKFIIIKSNYENTNPSLCGIFVLNNNDIESSNNIYYLYEPLNDIIMLSLEQLRNLFIDGTFEYLDSNYKIPGIELNDKIKVLSI